MGTVVQILEAPAGYNVGSVTAELYVPTGTTQPPVWAFTNPGTNLAIMFPTRAINYGGGSMVVDVDWYSTAGSTTGTVTWKVAVTSIAAGSAESIEAATGGTAGSTASTVNGTAKGLTRATITITSGNLDGIATGSDIWLNVQRDTSDTSMAGTAALKSITISYGDGLAGTPGSGDVVGPASSTNNDIAAFDLTTGKLIKDSGVLVTSVVVGPASATSGRIAVYNGTTGKLIQDGTKLEADVVTGPASVTTARLASYNGTTGKVIQDSGINTSEVVRNTTGTTVVSGEVPQFAGTSGLAISSSAKLAADLVTGPASSTTSRIASFNGTTGKVIQDSGVLVSAIGDFFGPGSSTSGNIVSFNGTTGKLGQDSGVSATAHSARHEPGGADSMFSGTFTTGDFGVYNGSTAFTPKFQAVSELTSNFSVVTGANTFGNITGISIALPRAGTYKIYASGLISLSGSITAGGSSWCFKYSGTTTRIAAAGGVFSNGTGLACYLYLYQNADGALTTQAGSGTTIANQQFHMSGSITVSTTGNLTLQVARSGTPTASVLAGTAIHVVEQ